jgi:hypothetical protein
MCAYPPYVIIINFFLKTNLIPNQTSKLVLIARVLNTLSTVYILILVIKKYERIAKKFKF